MDETEYAGSLIECNAVYMKNPEYICRNVAGETVLVPVGEAASGFNGIVTLNSTGAFIWDALDEQLTVSEIAEKLSEKYEVSRKESLEDCVEFLNIVREHNMIIKNV